MQASKLLQPFNPESETPSEQLIVDPVGSESFNTCVCVCVCVSVF